jgi:hypothetical protein
MNLWLPRCYGICVQRRVPHGCSRDGAARRIVCVERVRSVMCMDEALQRIWVWMVPVHGGLRSSDEDHS